jgi:drug/metabolite transporter (DMT)-like permease
VGRPFYLIISLVMAAVIVFGFAHTVPRDFTRTPALPILFHVHGAVFTLWVMLFVAQPAFIARGSVALHRKVGMIGAGVAAAMVVMGISATVYAVHEGFVPDFFPPRLFLVMNLLNVATFATLVTAGIAMRRRAEWHKRLMLCASVAILGPALGRMLPMAAMGKAAPAVMFAIILMFAFAGVVADLIIRRRVHPAYYWAIGAIVLSIVLIPVLAFSPPAGALLHLIRPQA